MRPPPILTIVFLASATQAAAQVTVDLHALQALPNRPAAPLLPRPAPSAAPRAPAVEGHQTKAPAAPLTALASPQIEPRTPPVAAAPASVAAPPASQPVMPQTVPDTASISPIPMPALPPGAQPPAPPVVSDKAVTAAAPTTTGLRLTFAPGESDLSPESSNSIKQLTVAAPAGDETTFNVLAYAPGKPDDPSTARRVSLSRAMTVRSALIADGVPSARIFVRALGEQYGKDPPDRVDLSVSGGTAPTDTATTR